MVSAYDHAILRARAPVPGEGMFVRRTRGGRPVLVVNDGAAVWAYAVHGTSDYHGGMAFDIRQPHLLRILP
jgi:hypothetical protein